MTEKALHLDRSRELLERSDELIVRGCQGHKRSHEMLALGYPVFTRRAQGALFWDADGNCYLDYLLAFGPVLLGYNDAAVNQAICRQIENGVIYTTAQPRELEVAAKIVDLIPCAEMVAFLIGGSAATSAAVRLARAYTGRDYVVRCGYHGWHSWCQPGSQGVPEAVGELTLAVPYNDLDALDDCLRQHEGKVACLILEAEQGAGPPRGIPAGRDRCLSLPRSTRSVR
jgi:glutamate-1-semialdehyde 2,1-aminomutase